jgi:hypothetical protein
MTASTLAKPPPAVAPAAGKLAAPVKDTPASRMRKQMDALSVFWRAAFLLTHAPTWRGAPYPAPAGNQAQHPGAQTRQVAAALLGTPAPPPRGPQPHAR